MGDRRQVVLRMWEAIFEIFKLHIDYSAGVFGCVENI